MLHLILRLLPARLHHAVLRIGYAARRSIRRRLKLHLSGVSLIAHDGAGRILLVRHSYGPEQWCFPGGGVDRGETPDQAARRELAEELHGTATSLTLLATLQETLAGAPHTAHIYALTLAEGWRIDGRELVEARFFDPDDLPQRLSSPTRRRIALWRDRGAAALQG
ncbi:NUDIX domain-containing protein [Altererythrobacter xixiisoli]|uniref:NUDIX domain-containing protein n=1 Tax=Croceibacterium xixiisoli TaxID=1476466 RepID=A0A6I4TX65_9SPHN|nr:NUDIX domain-containing protein [Croceibacterium xixiisoli]MXP00493.1 NUDIX domain-containing protein [Croceibacterium xixiisoli]